MKKVLLTLCPLLLFGGSLYAYDLTGTVSSGSAVIGVSVGTGKNIIDIGGVGVPEDLEFVEALAWMYDNKITDFGKPSNYRPFDKITREESAKMIGRFAKHLILDQPISQIQPISQMPDQLCEFVDSNDIAKELANDVLNACKMGLFRGGAEGFLPKGGLTKAQSLIVLVRLFDNKILSENIVPRYKNYYDRAYELGITKDKDINNFDRSVTRYEVALMIYRFHLKYELARQNGNLLSYDQFMGILPDSIITTNGMKKGSALFNPSILSNSAIDSFQMDIFGDVFTVKKRKTDNLNAGNNNYISYGELYNVDGKIYLGAATFSVINGFVYEGNVRPTELGNKYYTIKQSTQQPYYIIEEKFSE